MTRIATSDGVALEAEWTPAIGERLGAVVLCHPHPLDGGSMRAPLIVRVARALADAGLAVLRFNFRGVGASTGSWGDGINEKEDVAAAVATASDEGDLVGLAGWSFGATTSLLWQADAGSTLPWAGIAPGITPYRGHQAPEPDHLPPARRLVIAGDRDQFASVAEFTAFAGRIGATIELLPGSDHFFVFRERRVGALVAEHFGGRPSPEEAEPQRGG